MIDEFMTFPRLAELEKHWQRHPPAHLLVAAFMGYKPPEEQRYGTWDDLLSDFQAAGGRVGRV